MVPHKRNSKVWPGLVTKEKTMKYPISAMCTMCVRVHTYNCASEKHVWLTTVSRVSTLTYVWWPWRDIAHRKYLCKYLRCRKYLCKYLCKYFRCLQIFAMSQISLQISLQIFLCAMSQISLQISLQIFAMSQILSHTLSHTLLHSLHICAGHFFKSLKGLKVVWVPAFIPLTCTHGWVVGCSLGMIDYSSALSACVYIGITMEV